MEHKLVEEDCLRLLEKFLAAKDFELKSFEVVPFHSALQGLIGEPFTLTVQYVFKNEIMTQEFFVKTLSTNPLLLKFSKSALVYEKEAFYYNLLHEFEKYNIDTSFAPRGYLFRPYIVVLQDLSKLKFKGTPKKTLLDLDHCQICLDTLAKFHAASIIYEKRKSDELGKKYSLQEEFGEVLEDKFSGKEESLPTTCLLTAVKGLFEVIDLIPENHISHDAFKAKLHEVLTDDTPMEGLLSGILHGDAWTSNFLYLYANNRPVSSKLLDFQMIKYGPIEGDFVEFLMTNTSREFRKLNFNSLTERYYKNMEKELSKAGFGGVLPDCSAFVGSCEKFKLAGKIHAIVDHSFTFVADEVWEDVASSEEKLQKFLLEERGEYIQFSYKNSKAFRETLTEDVLELRDLLFS